MIADRMKALVNNSSIIRAMFEEGKRLSDIYGEENVYDYSIGNPNVEPPEQVRQSVIDILREEPQNLVHGYMNNSGYEDVRGSIAEFINRTQGTDIDFSNIIMTVGAAGGLNIILKSIINPGDEVITISPYFGEYNNYVNNFDGKLIEVKADTKDFQPNFEEFEKAINPKTKAVIINNPNNPTGVVYSEASIQKMADILNAKQKEYNTDIFIISDEPYRELVYDDVKIPYILNYYDNSFIGYSYSKSLSLPGERIGYVVISNKMSDIENIKVALNVANRILGFVNAPSLFQRVIARNLGVTTDMTTYRENRDILYKHLTSLGFEMVKPEGTFYMFPKSLIPDDVAFAEAAKKYNLLIVPGSSFGCPGYFRLSYCISTEKVKNSLQAFTKLAEEFK
ncbi:pyridoxal phosphate-dependent aminotransferase [Clostridium sp. MSJ-8]|uniref:pyridoxal phosphate-dependent aminotransferase n=1 Tax=Clostridium sp. MSJ-8 TaxID=2841510 RepID=UPI001C0ED096|nr:pyridoxal phosphate-dependent aminotransferase [Clostridium sp. MSJ-8]MBU5488045.1 pyridoxal phosphate-dependent aminotransferase [Clostridium sp. MSJ-8]